MVFVHYIMMFVFFVWHELTVRFWKAMVIALRA